MTLDSDYRVSLPSDPKESEISEGIKEKEKSGTKQVLNKDKSPIQVPPLSSRRADKVEWRVRNIPIEFDYEVRVKAKKQGFNTISALLKALVFNWIREGE